jgi:hypothetical protein
MAAAIEASGRHEFGVHGWIHELNATVHAVRANDPRG